MKATVAERGQVTIPKSLREKLGIKPGTVLEFRLETDRLVAEKIVSKDPVERVFGILKIPGGTDSVMRALRGGAE